MSKKISSRLLSILLCFSLCFSSLVMAEPSASDAFTESADISAGAQADGTTSLIDLTGDDQTASVTCEKELYDASDYRGFKSVRDVISDPDAADSVTASATSAVALSTLKSLGATVRSKMVNRNNSISVSVPMSQLYDSATYSNIVDAILDYAFEETSACNEGDYLAWQVGSTRCSFTYSKTSLNITYYFTYYTTASEEAATASYVNSALNALKIGSCSTAYSKITHIYDYICDTVSYDYSALASYYSNSFSNFYPYTAYSAIVNKKAVCQGISLLFYRMAKASGINCRVVYSTDHMWNIVYLNGSYYNLDATFDLTTDSGGTGVSYFLLTDASINKDGYHTREAGTECVSAVFLNAYPSASVNYVTSLSAELPSVSIWSLESGRRTGTCKSCGRRLYAPAVTCTGHTYKISKAASYASAGSKYCTNCGQVVTIAKKTVGTPASLSASSMTNHRVKLTWTKVSDASGYRIYRRLASSSAYSVVATVSSSVSSYTDSSVTAGNNYYYYVKAYHTENGKSYWGSASEKVLITPLPNAPKLGFTRKYSGSSILFKWYGVTGARYYVIYRKTGAGGTYKRLRTVGSNARRIVDTTAKKGVTYYYTVRALCKEGSKYLAGYCNSAGIKGKIS